MKPAIQITETEWEIMRVVWAHHPISSTALIERLIAADATWHPKTARALISRLVGKKALRYEVQGRSHVYEPLVTERESIATASETFLERILGGSLKPMLTYFVEQKQITKRDLEELRALLEGRTAPRKPRRKP